MQREWRSKSLLGVEEVGWVVLVIHLVGCVSYKERGGHVGSNLFPPVNNSRYVLDLLLKLPKPVDGFINVLLLFSDRQNYLFSYL